MAALSVAYLYACGYRLPRTKAPASPGGPLPARALCSPFQFRMFWLSQLILALSLMSPLDYVSDTYLFSAHMIQHLILASVWPAVLLLSIPEQLAAPLYRGRNSSAIIRAVTFPAVALIVFNVDLSVWHIPYLYDLTLTNANIHIFEHVTFMATGVIAWFPVLNPVRSRRLAYGMQELYLFANLFPMMALGIFYSFWQHALYAPYIAAPRLWGITPVTDQQIGGLIMWMPGDLPFAFAMLIIGMNWLEKGDPKDLPSIAASIPDAVS